MADWVMAPTVDYLNDFIGRALTALAAVLNSLRFSGCD